MVAAPDVGDVVAVEEEVAVIDETEDVADFEEEEVVVVKKPKAVKPKKVLDEDEVEVDDKE